MRFILGIFVKNHYVKFLQGNFCHQWVFFYFSKRYLPSFRKNIKSYIPKACNMMWYAYALPTFLHFLPNLLHFTNFNNFFPIFLSICPFYSHFPKNCPFFKILTQFTNILAIFSNLFSNLFLILQFFFPFANLCLFTHFANLFTYLYIIILF